jgi:chemotaxis protein MotC
MACLIALLASVASGAAMADEPVRVFTVVPIAAALREFVRRGDAALTGDTDVVHERQELGRTISEEFAAEPPSIWENQGNAAELLKFVLFGGPGGVLEKAIEQGVFPKQYETTARGLVAFSRRDLELARKYLTGDARDELPSDVRDPLALVRGTLISATDPEQAIRHFRHVQLVAPGTALEEAALRQHVMVLLRQKNIADAVTKIAVYLRRFPASIYWTQFAGTAATAAVRIGDLAPSDLLSVSTEITVPARRSRYHEFLLEISKRLIGAGAFEKAAEISAHVAEKSVTNERHWHVAQLYKSVCAAVTASSGDALAQLRSLDASHFTSEEKALMSAGIEIGSDVQKGYRVASGEPQSSTARQQAPAAEDVQAIRALPDDLDGKVNSALAAAREKLSEVRP